MARGDSGEGLTGEAGIVSGGEDIGGIGDVYEVMGDSGALVGRKLGRTDVEKSIDFQ